MYATNNFFWLARAYYSNFQIFKILKLYKIIQFNILRLIYFYYNDQLPSKIENFDPQLTLILNNSFPQDLKSCYFQYLSNFYLESFYKKKKNLSSLLFWNYDVVLKVDF